MSNVNCNESDKPGSQQRIIRALEFIASKSRCECWDVPGMGLPYVWGGCRPHHSDDPEEWCLCCTAHEALQTLRPNEKGQR